MQGKHQIQSSGGVFAKGPSDWGAQVPQRGRAAQLRLPGDLQVAAQRLQPGPHGVDYQLMFVAVLARTGQRGTVGGIDGRVVGAGAEPANGWQIT